MKVVQMLRFEATENVETTGSWRTCPSSMDYRLEWHEKLELNNLVGGPALQAVKGVLEGCLDCCCHDDSTDVCIFLQKHPFGQFDSGS